MTVASRSFCPRRRRPIAAVVAVLGLLGACAGSADGGPGRVGRPPTEPPRATVAVAEQLETFGADAAGLLRDGGRPGAALVPAEVGRRPGNSRWADQAQPMAVNAGGGDPGGALYRLNPQDLLRIFVWGEEELQREVVVQPDGSVSFPLIGQVAVAGRTVDEVQAEIAARLDRFIPGAVATVELLEARGSKIYIMGEVANPGEYPLSAPLTIVQAISRAGGFTEYAATDRIRVLRRGDGEEEATLTVNYDRIASGRDRAGDVDLRAGDTVIVPAERLFSLF